MMTTGIVIGSVWFIAALVFTLALMRRAGRPMPHPLASLAISDSRRRSTWNRGLAEWECRHRHFSRSSMPLIAVKRLGEVPVANLHAPRRMRRLPSAESGV